MEADLIIHNAKIYTVDENWTIAEAVAIKDGRIIDIGAERNILNKYSSKEKIDAGTKPVYPGFIDAHCHFLWYGQSLNEADLSGTKSSKEIVELLSKRKPNRGEWITGRGWDQNDWPEKSFPDKGLLDEQYPDTPVFLVRIDGHAAWVNQKALEIAGITGAENISGGTVVTENRKPTGILIDRAMEMVSQHLPEPTSEEIAGFIEQAEEKCFAAGITALADAGLPVERIKVLQELDQSGDIRMNIYQMLSPGEGAEAFMRDGQHQTEHVLVRSLKLFADGALGSRGAAMIEPYSDHAHHHGLFLNEQAHYDYWAALCKENNYQLCMHAIGDSANRMVLDLYGKHLQGSNDLRWRIEHAQVVHPDDFKKFRQYNIIPSVQPTHATSDWPWAEERLGPERIKTAYAFETLRQQNGLVALGTDFPIEQIDPLATFYAAVYRKSNGQPEAGFQMEEALDKKDALRGMTIWAAIASFDEANRGSIEKGKAADFVILNHDLLETPESQFKNIEVTHTLVNGELVYKSY